jgi:hypothetical protein
LLPSRTSGTVFVSLPSVSWAQIARRSLDLRQKNDTPVLTYFNRRSEADPKIF